MENRAQNIGKAANLKHSIYTVLVVVVFGGILLTGSIGFGLGLKKQIQEKAVLDSLKKEKLKLEIEILKKNNYH